MFFSRIILSGAFLFYSQFSFAIIYGKSIPENVFPQVVKVEWKKNIENHESKEKEVLVRIGTASVVNKDTLLTSAHFFFHQSIGAWSGKSININGEPFKIKSIWVNPKFNSKGFLENKMSRVDLNDFAIVTLEDFSFKGDPLIISKKILRFGERVRMVGHGQHFPKKPVDTDEVFSTYFGKWRAVPELPYQKSVGTNQAVELYNTLPKNTYRFYAMGGKFDGVEHYKSGIFPGDSGGPLVNESGEIVGVAHKISFSGGTVLTSTFLDVTRPDVREIIENKISKDNVML